MLRFFIVLLCLTTPLYSLTFDINESQIIILESDRVIIDVNGEINITNITSYIYDISFESKKVFPINLIQEINISKGNYAISTVIPKSFYNEYLATGKTFLEYCTEIIIQTNRDVTLTKYQRTSNESYASRPIKIEIINPTNYTQYYSINLIKTRPNQVNEFRNTIYLKSQEELLIDPLSSHSFFYIDELSELGDSYFVEYDVLIIPTIVRLVSKTVTTKDLESKRGGSGSSFPTLLKNLSIEKTVDPLQFKKGDIIKIIVRISNPNGFSLQNISLQDSIPQGFIYVNNPEAIFFEQELSFLPFETKEIIYYVQYNEDKEFVTIPSAVIEQGLEKVQSNRITLYPTIAYFPEFYIEKIITPLDENVFNVKLIITNIGNKTSASFLLEDEEQEYYIPQLEPKENHLISYQSKSISFKEPIFSKPINVTTSVIINDEISVYHPSKPTQSYYTLGLIFLAGFLLISDLVL